MSDVVVSVITTSSQDGRDGEVRLNVAERRSKDTVKTLLRVLLATFMSSNSSVIVVVKVK